MMPTSKKRGKARQGLISDDDEKMAKEQDLQNSE